MDDRKNAAVAASFPRSLLTARSIRALLALVFVVVGASIAVRIAPFAADGLRHAAGASPASADGWMDATTSLGIILLAVVGAVVFGRWLWLGDKHRGLGVLGVPTALGGVSAAIGIACLAGGAIAVPQDGPRGGAALFAGGSLLICAAAAGEEILVRGLLQPLLIRAWGAAPGILLASLGFAVVHVSGGWIAPVSLINIFVAGLWFGLLAWRTGGFLAPSLAHAAWNWSEAMLFGAYPNGPDPYPWQGAYGTLIDVNLIGPAWLGGSGDGLDGSLLLTAVLAAIIVPLAVPLRAAKPAPARRS